jgi:protein-L-isoaspartate O-methyltransferase
MLWLHVEPSQQVEGPYLVANFAQLLLVQEEKPVLEVAAASRPVVVEAVVALVMHPLVAGDFVAVFVVELVLVVWA